MPGCGAKFFDTKTLQEWFLAATLTPDGRQDHFQHRRASDEAPSRTPLYVRGLRRLARDRCRTCISRLRARGEIRRARKGVYYVPRRTVLGEVPADPVVVGELVGRGRSHLAGLSAANALGLTTQVPARTELAVEDKANSTARGGIQAAHRHEQAPPAATRGGAARGAARRQPPERPPGTGDGPEAPPSAGGRFGAGPDSAFSPERATEGARDGRCARRARRSRRRRASASAQDTEPDDLLRLRAAVGARDRKEVGCPRCSTSATTSPTS